jgi:hypothetical protein
MTVAMELRGSFDRRLAPAWIGDKIVAGAIQNTCKPGHTVFSSVLDLDKPLHSDSSIDALVTNLYHEQQKGRSEWTKERWALS